MRGSLRRTTSYCVRGIKSACGRPSERGGIRRLEMNEKRKIGSPKHSSLFVFEITLSDVGSAI
jgi:hypothetical protein